MELVLGFTVLTALYIPPQPFYLHGKFSSRNLTKTICPDVSVDMTRKQNVATLPYRTCTHVCSTVLMPWKVPVLVMSFAINICADCALPKLADCKTLMYLQTLVLASVAC
jgi:hypothetical protein